MLYAGCACGYKCWKVNRVTIIWNANTMTVKQ